jgi:hypothetical protein
VIVGSVLLVAVAMVLLAFGLVYLDEPLLYCSIGVSALAALTLVAGVRRLAAIRAERGVLAFRSGPGAWTVQLGAASTGLPAPSPAGIATARPVGRATPRPVGRAAVRPVLPADVDDLVDEPLEQVDEAQGARLADLAATVVVVDGLPRYHLQGCARLVDAEGEELAPAEAVELGFTPCGACRPVATLLRGD